MKSYGVKTANLDGGGSSTMYLNGQVINKPTTNGNISERAVSDTPTSVTNPSKTFQKTTVSHILLTIFFFALAESMNPSAWEHLSICTISCPSSSLGQPLPSL